VAKGTALARTGRKPEFFSLGRSFRISFWDVVGFGGLSSPVITSPSMWDLSGEFVSVKNSQRMPDPPDDKDVQGAVKLLKNIVEIPDGVRLSRHGAWNAIHSAAVAYKVELADYKPSANSSVLSQDLEQLSKEIASVAGKLTTLSTEAQARLSRIPSEWLWPEDSQFTKLRVPYLLPLSLERARQLASDLGAYLTSDDEDFIQARAHSLVPILTTTPLVNSPMIQELRALAAVMSRASAINERAKVDGTAEKSYRESHMHPTHLLIRECDAILTAAEGMEPTATYDSPEQTKADWKTHPKLRSFATEVYESATGVPKANSAIDGHLRDYRNSHRKSIDVHPWVWRTFRVAELLWTDLKLAPEAQQAACSDRLAELADISKRFRRLTEFQVVERTGSGGNELSPEAALQLSHKKRVKGRTHLS